MRKTVVLMGLVLGLSAAFGATGCKNVCEKAADKALDCMRGYCEEHSEEGPCAQFDQIEEQFNQRMAEEAGECTGDDATQAQTMLDQDCEAMTAMLRGGPPAAAPAGESEGE